MLPKTIKEYHQMTLSCIESSKKGIGILRNGVDEEDKQGLVAIIQEALDDAAAVLLRLENAGAAIQPTLITTFYGLNAEIELINAEFNAGLIAREIGDVPIRNYEDTPEAQGVDADNSAACAMGDNVTDAVPLAGKAESGSGTCVMS